MLCSYNRSCARTIVISLLGIGLSRAANAQQPLAPPSQQPPPSSNAATNTPANTQPTSPSHADFFSKTQATLVDQNVSGNSITYHYSLTFPTNTSGDLKVTLHVDASYSPTANDLKLSGPGPYIYGLSSNTTPNVDGSQISGTLKYFVPYSSLPAAAVAQLHALVRPQATSQVRKGGRLLNASFVYANPVQLGTQTQSNPAVLGVGVSEQATFGEPSAADADAFEQSAGEGNPISTTSQASSLASKLNQILSANPQLADLLRKLLLYQSCAHDTSVQNLQNGQPQPQDAAMADQYIQNALSWLDTDFMFKISTVVPVIGDWAPGIVSSTTLQDLQTLLQQMQLLLPYCRGMWYGTYSMTTVSGALSTVDSGALRLLSIGGPISIYVQGGAVGHFKYRNNGANGCSTWSNQGDTDYTASIAGGATANGSSLPQGMADVVTIGTKSITQPQCQVTNQSNDCGTTASETNSVAIGGWSFTVRLLDNYTTQGPYPNPSPVAQSPGTTGQYQVTVHQLR
jgi:hypothetical protein